MFKNCLPLAVTNVAAIKSKGGATNKLKRGGKVLVTVKNPFRENTVTTVNQTKNSSSDRFEKCVAL
ncbi:MAG: hypothetical protein AVDCRST_MAG96-3228 [uncultured Segetibacter sp.]|uniref:Uncharacterized protein n=1 Tax=uncultured Segetibacter sp. TaxID=481133 RepID=A0A6J4TKC4_9BACT|nr:MAG: hypothetical protein AVDCRST_MAG96-3228 [uncultured Segetibacter sp.]